MDLSTYVYMYILLILSLLITPSFGETLTHLNITNGALKCTIPGLCNIDCTEGPTTWLCHAIDIICLDGYDCLITCGNADCLEGTLQCPNGGRCDIIGNCFGSKSGSCFNNKDIYCPPSDDECTMDVKGAPVGQLLLHGGGGDLSFSGSPKEHNGKSMIDCPANKRCSIHCGDVYTGHYSCDQAIVNATSSAHLNLTGYSISSGEVYCPRSNVRGNTGICNIQMSSATGLSGLVIHAVEGYNDVSLSCKDGVQCYNDANPPQISCTAQDESTCVLTATNAAFTEWKCINESSVCQDYLIPTYAPTIPTFDPTNDPTIIPTTDPTIDPTSAPTTAPTIDPTSAPTTAPTIDPTSAPTTAPTSEPTADPTADPTSMPTVPPEPLTHLNITNGVLECTLPGLCTIDCTEGPTTWLCHAVDMICLDGFDCLIMCGNADCLEGSLRCPNGGRCDIIGDCDGSSTGSCFNNKDIYCPPSDHECTMSVKSAPVGQLKLYGGGGDLSFSGPQKEHNGKSIIDCPVNKQCSINCGYVYNQFSCDQAIVNASASSRLNLTGHSISSGEVYCPRNNVRGNTGVCHIEMASANGLSGVVIHAVEGYNDIDLSCKDGIQCYSDANPPKISCTAQDDSTCVMTATNAAFTEWKCVNESSVCQDYLIPTDDPTISTSDPTIGPTLNPTMDPSTVTSDPTRAPTAIPTRQPTSDPSSNPSVIPTQQSLSPSTTSPSSSPTTVSPTLLPSAIPTTTVPTSAMPTTAEPTTTTVVQTGTSDIEETVMGSRVFGVAPNPCIWLVLLIIFTLF
eukprot:10256_1